MSVDPLYRVAPAVAVLAALCLPATAEGQVSRLNNGSPRFQLYTGCAPVGLLVAMGAENVPGLTRSAVEIAARSRLRGARIFDRLVRPVDLRERESPVLHVSILGYEPINSFSVALALYKPVGDSLSGASGMAITWEGAVSVGHHAGDGGYVLQSHRPAYGRVHRPLPSRKRRGVQVSAGFGWTPASGKHRAARWFTCAA